MDTLKTVSRFRPGAVMLQYHDSHDSTRPHRVGAGGAMCTSHVGQTNKPAVPVQALMAAQGCSASQAALRHLLPQWSGSLGSLSSRLRLTDPRQLTTVSFSCTGDGASRTCAGSKALLW